MAKSYRGSANYASSCRIDHFQHENSDCDDYQAGLLRPMYAASQVMSVCIYDRDFHLTLTALLHYIAKLKCSKLSPNFCQPVERTVAVRLTGCIVYTNIQPVVKPVWQPVWQPAVSCIQPVVNPVVQTGLTTGWTNSGCSFNTVVKRVVIPFLTTGCIVQTNIQPLRPGLTTGLTTGCIV